jgi:hypothetical protein
LSGHLSRAVRPGVPGQPGVSGQPGVPGHIPHTKVCHLAGHTKVCPARRPGADAPSVPRHRGTFPAARRPGTHQGVSSQAAHLGVGNRCPQGTFPTARCPGAARWTRGSQVDTGNQVLSLARSLALTGVPTPRCAPTVQPVGGWGGSPPTPYCVGGQPCGDIQ